MPHWQRNKHPEQKHLISRTPLQESMNQNSQSLILHSCEDSSEVNKNSVGKRRRRRRGKGTHLTRMEDAAAETGVISSPSSERDLSFPLRPGYGSLGSKCVVKANHFIAEISEKNLCHYSVGCCSDALLLFFKKMSPRQNDIILMFYPCRFQ